MTYVKSRATGDGNSAPDTFASNLESIAAKLSAPASSLAPPGHTMTVPGHIANILQVILLHDKFDQNFDKWNLIAGDDRDVLVLTLKTGAQIDSSLVYTICMMYPFRIHGPLVIKNTMHIEFLHDNRLETVSVTANITPKNIEYTLGTCLHERKRQRLGSTTIAKNAQSITTDDGNSAFGKSADASKQKTDAREDDEHGRGAVDLNLDSIRRKLSTALQASNNSRVFIEQVRTGFDAAGSWITFQLSECDKLNLDFFGSFQLAIDDLPLKVCNHSVPDFKNLKRNLPLTITDNRILSTVAANSDCQRLFRLSSILQCEGTTNRIQLAVCPCLHTENQFVLPCHAHSQRICIDVSGTHYISHKRLAQKFC
jgi:hypothetical protein